MNKEKKKYNVTIFGEQYVLISDEPFEHVVRVSGLVDSIMQDIAGASKISDPKKIAVLAALQMADKLVALKATIEKEKMKHKELLGRIDQECSSALSP